MRGLPDIPRQRFHGTQQPRNLFAIASAAQRPCLSAFLLPFGAPARSPSVSQLIDGPKIREQVRAKRPLFFFAICLVWRARTTNWLRGASLVRQSRLVSSPIQKKVDRNICSVIEGLQMKAACLPGLIFAGGAVLGWWRRKRKVAAAMHRPALADGAG